MPDVQEVFRLATSKVQPDPDALERQVRRQRAAARKSRVRAYVAVAAVLVVLGVAVFAISQAVRRNDVTPVGQGSTTQTDLTFLQALPAGATPQTPAIVDRRGKQTSTIEGVPLDAYAPSVTSDGTQMAFVAAPNELAYNQIGVMSTDGTGAHFVTTPGILVDGVAISPDGTRIAFEGETEGNFPDIYVVNSDGTGLRQLTTDPATDQYPAWSPDGKTIVYDNAGAQEKRDAQFSKTAELFTVSVDGGPVRRITHNNSLDAAPTYSPDGKTIVDQSLYGLSMMDPNGGHYRGFSIAAPSAFTPRFAPDGKTIAFTYYKAVPQPRQPTPQFGVEFAGLPIVILSIVDTATRKVTKLTRVAMASDINTPQWIDDQHVFVMRVPANGV
jgi:Tol biopolymer transport system component